MKKQFVLAVSKDEVHMPTLQKHLSKHGLLLHDSSNQTWIFKNEKSFWEGWKVNPLKWEASLEMKWLENSVVIQLEVNTSHRMSTKAAMHAWKVLLKQVKRLLLHGGWSETELQNAIEQAQSSVMIRMIFQFVVVLVLFYLLDGRIEFNGLSIWFQIGGILIITFAYQMISTTKIDGDI